jgi:hypothetical protein
VLASVKDFDEGRLTHTAAAKSAFTMLKFEIRALPSFTDYLRSGWGISMACGIDYNASRKAPSTQNFRRPYDEPHNWHDQYEQALYEVGSIIEHYDQDRCFPTFGFGGIPRHIEITGLGHCFPLNGNAANPEILGVEEIIRTIRATKYEIEIGGPIYFAPLLNEFHRFITAREGMRTYYIILLLTNGVIDDMLETIQAIVNLSSLPCSIIIVGLCYGYFNFENMHILDGDGGPLRDNQGRQVNRDIVQFVAYNECIKQGNLAEEVLKEVPNQFVSYMTMKGIAPDFI